MPGNAATLLAENEFNRYYIRAVCLVALKNKMSEVEVYRAKQTSSSRANSENKIGLRLPAKKITGRYKKLYR